MGFPSRRLVPKKYPWDLSLTGQIIIPLVRQDIGAKVIVFNRFLMTLKTGFVKLNRLSSTFILSLLNKNHFPLLSWLYFCKTVQLKQRIWNFYKICLCEIDEIKINDFHGFIYSTVLSGIIIWTKTFNRVWPKNSMHSSILKEKIHTEDIKEIVYYCMKIARYSSKSN